MSSRTHDTGRDSEAERERERDAGLATRLDLERLALFAREDARDAVRERQAHVLGALFALVCGGTAYSAGRSAANAPPGTAVELLPTQIGPLVLLLPLVTLGIVAPALVEKRSTGALTVLLGLPFSRRTVVVGTLLGRSLVVGAALLTAMVVALLIGLVMGTAVAPLEFVGATVALLVLAVAFTAIAVAISAVTRTSTRASFAAFGAYVVFVFELWGQLPMLVLYVLRGFRHPETTPTWAEVFASLNPLTAFSNLLGGFLPELSSGLFVSLPAEPAIYERPAVAAVVLFGWIVVATELGYRRFRSTDL